MSGASRSSAPRKTRSVALWEPTSNSWLPAIASRARKTKTLRFASTTGACSSLIDERDRVNGSSRPRHRAPAERAPGSRPRSDAVEPGVGRLAGDADEHRAVRVRRCLGIGLPLVPFYLFTHNYAMIVVFFGLQGWFAGGGI